MLEFALILLIILAIAAIQTRYLRHAVIYLGVFSLAISYVYLLYKAPDVALAEAVIGSTIATILYLVALQKYKIFTIYYCIPKDHSNQSLFLSTYKQQLVKTLEKFCTKQELEAQFIYSIEPLEMIKKKRQYALIIEEDADGIIFYGHPENYKLDALELFLSSEAHFKHRYRIVKPEEEVL